MTNNSPVAHPDAMLFAHLLPTYPDIPDHVWHIMLSYRPHASGSAWHAVREFTIATALTMRPGSYDQTRRLMTMTARFHVWAWTLGVRSLTAADVYSQHRIDRYLNTDLRKRSESHRWGTSRQLIAVGRALTDNTLRVLTAPEFAGPSPFKPGEIASMHGWARSLSTEHKRQNASVLLGLAGGAGLRSEEIVAARVGDVEVCSGRVFVHVRHDRARRVPVRHSWARMLLQGVGSRTAPDAPLFCGHRFAEYPPRVIQAFLSDNPARVRPTVSRLRATWLLHHLNRGVPIHVLREVGGYQGYEALIRYVDFLATPDIGAFTGLLIGEEIV